MNGKSNTLYFKHIVLIINYVQRMLIVIISTNSLITLNVHMYKYYLQYMSVAT